MYIPIVRIADITTKLYRPSDRVSSLRASPTVLVHRRVSFVIAYCRRALRPYVSLFNVSTVNRVERQVCKSAISCLFPPPVPPKNNNQDNGIVKSPRHVDRGDVKVCSDSIHTSESPTDHNQLHPASPPLVPALARTYTRVRHFHELGTSRNSSARIDIPPPRLIL